MDQHGGLIWIDGDEWGSVGLWSLGIVAIVAASKVILIPYTFYVRLGLRRDVFFSQVDPSGQRGTSFQRSRNVMTVNGALNWNMIGSLKYIWSCVQKCSECICFCLFGVLEVQWPNLWMVFAVCNQTARDAMRQEIIDLFGNGGFQFLVYCPSGIDGSIIM